MKLTINAASGKNIIHQNIISLTTMTESGEITVLPGHVPMVTVVRPGILRVIYRDTGNEMTEEYITGGGVMTITDDIAMIVDSLDEEDALDEEDILAKKAEAEKLMQQYHDENPENRDAQYAMELEYQYLKYAAMQEMSKKLRSR